MTVPIIGIDPGSRFTGYGIITGNNSQPEAIHFGRIVVAGHTVAEKLYDIFSKLQDIIHTYQPGEFAIEQVFFHRNAQSALKLGQARGAALTAAAACALPVSEYSPKQIKQAVVGYGGAEKSQVQHMVRALLRLKSTPDVDAADALAIALCHCHTRHLARTLSNNLSI